MNKNWKRIGKMRCGKARGAAKRHVTAAVLCQTKGLSMTLPKRDTWGTKRWEDRPVHCSGTLLSQSFQQFLLWNISSARWSLWGLSLQSTFPLSPLNPSTFWPTLGDSGVPHLLHLVWNMAPASWGSSRKSYPVLCFDLMPNREGWCKKRSWCISLVKKTISLCTSVLETGVFFKIRGFVLTYLIFLL